MARYFKPLLLFAIIIIYLRVFSVKTTEVSPGIFSTFNFTELEEVLYDVEILREPVPDDLGDEKHVHTVEVDGDTHGLKRDPGTSYLTLMSKHGQKYFCTLPTPQSDLQNPDDPSQVESTEQRYLINVSALLQPMKRRPCISKTVGWWTYEYCHGKFIKQYHQEAGELVKSQWLGFYENETVWDKERIKYVEKLKKSIKSSLAAGQHSLAYHTVYYVNGTECDITGKLRTARVKIFCDMIGEDKIVDIQETETCNYTLTVQSSLLCAHPFFKNTPGNKALPLSCSPVISKQEYLKYLEKKETEKRKAAERAAIEKEKLTKAKGKLKPEMDELPTYDSIVNSFLSNSGLFDSGEEEEEDEDDEEEGESVQNDQDAEGESNFILEPEEKKAGKSHQTKSREKSHLKLKPWEELFTKKSTPRETTTTNERKSRTDSSEEELNTEFDKLLDAVQSIYMNTLMELGIESKETTDEKNWKTPIKHAIKMMQKGDINSEKDDQVRYQSKKTHLKEKVKENIATGEHRNLPPSRDDRKVDSKKTLEEFQGRDQLHQMDSNEAQSTKDEEESITVEEYLQQLKNKKQKNFASSKNLKFEDSDLDVDSEGEGDDLTGEEIEALEELDEESLTQLEEEINKEVQQHLKEAGINFPGQVEVKVFSMPSSVINNLLDEEEEEEEEEEVVQEEEEEEMGVGGGSLKIERTKGSRSSKIKVFNVRLYGDATKRIANSDGTVSFSQLLNEFLDPMTEERKKVQEMESSYEQVWEDKDSTSEKKKEIH